MYYTVCRFSYCSAFELQNRLLLLTACRPVDVPTEKLSSRFPTEFHRPQQTLFLFYRVLNQDAWFAPYNSFQTSALLFTLFYRKSTESHKNFDSLWPKNFFRTQSDSFDCSLSEDLWPENHATKLYRKTKPQTSFTNLGESQRPNAQSIRRSNVRTQEFKNLKESGSVVDYWKSLSYQDDQANWNFGDLSSISTFVRCLSVELRAFFFADSFQIFLVRIVCPVKYLFAA